METLLAQERAAEEHVRGLLKSGQLEIVELPATFRAYRPLSLESIFVDFYNVESREQRLWDLHQEGRRALHLALQRFRQEPKRVVERRELTKLYLRFLKDSEKFYRQYIYRLNTACGGIPELQHVALAQKQDDEGESPQTKLPTEFQRVALESCHRSLIYLGDLSRYRATEKLDNEPDFGPALGYYGLAAKIKPTSGQGHHQQAVIALDQKDYSRVLYCLYRALCVPEPYLHAQKNLDIAIAKINSASARGELIQKTKPNDQGDAQRALEGWFVRLHAMCYKGDEFRGYDELEAEVLNRLATCVKLERPIEHMLSRMVLTNIGAEFLAGERFQKSQDEPILSSWIHLLFFNIKTFTFFLRLFSEDLRATLLRLENPDIEPAALLTQTVRRLLPCLRVYTNWLVKNLQKVLGIVEAGVPGADCVWQFWSSYAKALDLINQAFSIWELDGSASVDYMLEEDVNTLQFLPVSDDANRDTWYNGFSGHLKPLHSDSNVVCRSPDEEMLHRVRDFLNKGSTIAFHEPAAPINLQGTRIFFGSEENIEPPVLRPIEPESQMSKSKPVQEKPKPVSYATAAANGHAKNMRPPPAVRAASSKGQSRDAQLSRMVDDLVDDDDSNNPITPPQQVVSNPAIIANGEAPPYALQDSVQDVGNGQKKTRYTDGQPVKPIGTGREMVPGQHGIRDRNPKATHGHQDRMHSVSNLWNDSSMISPSFPSGLPTGTLASPARPSAHAHSRVNSASSVRSRNSLNAVEPRGSADFAPRTLPDDVVPATSYGNYSSLDQTGVTSPFLFGAGGSVWSPGASHGFRNTSPPHGRGG